MKLLKRMLATLICGCLFMSLSAQVIKQEADELKKNKVTDSDTIMGWKYSGFFSLNFSQTALTNWAAGGTGSYAVLGNTNLTARYKSEMILWENNLLLNYGMIKVDGSPLQKNDDRIELNSRIGRKAFGDWYYSGFASFKTQFDATFTEGRMISNFMSPAWLQFALGMSYSKNEHFSVLLAPIAGKFTFVNEQRLADSGDYGVKKAILDPVTFAVITPGQRFRPEIGAFVMVMANYDIVKNVNLATKLDLFNNYTDENKPNRKNIDVNWETRVNMKVNKFLTATLFTHLIYDQDILIEVRGRPEQRGPRTQFKQVLGIGISHKFG